MVGRLLAGIAAKKAAAVKEWFSEERRERIDSCWPLNIALGRGVRIDPTPFLLAGSTLVAEPKGEFTVAGAGKTSHDSGQIDYFFYLQEQGGGEALLKVSVDRVGQVIDVSFWRQLDELYPQTEAEWGDWLDGSAGMIGMPEFYVDDVAFGRTFPSGAARVAPFAFKEKATADPFGEPTTFISHRIASYARKTGDAVERLTLDHVTDDEGDAVRITVGIDLKPAFIAVI